MTSDSLVTETVMEKARSLGASVAGIARVEDLKQSPSHLIYPKIGADLEKHWRDAQKGNESLEVAWPEDAVSSVVIGVEHGPGEPELDWWDGKGTPGNRILQRINREISEWLESAFGCRTYKLPYLVEKNGIFLKDAAVLAGLGSVGINNLVVTPEYGPRIRFRALLIDRELQPTGPLEFNPCESCGQPCRAACPKGAFANAVYTPRELDQAVLPGTDGTYDRVVCNTKLEEQIEEASKAMRASEQEHQEIRESVQEFEECGAGVREEDFCPEFCVKFCRECELSCPAGE